MRFLVALAVSAVAADTNTATLEGTTWKAKTWSGAAARGGDPDPYDDESTVEITGGKISWTGGGGGGPYAIASLPATARSPDNEEIKFSLNSDGDLVVEFGYASPATIVYARQGAASTAATDGCPDALWTVAKADNFDATGGPEQIVVVGGTQGLNVGSDVCIETNADGKNVDVQVYDLAMSLDAIKQGIRDELGAGDLCLWRKDGTLMTDGTLESNGVGRGDNLYAVLRASSMAAPAYTCPRSGTVPINHRGDFPGRITCGCERTGEPDHYFTAEPLCRMCKADEQYWAYRVDGQCQCVKTTGAGHTDCLAKGTCAPDPTCAPVIDVDGTTSTSALEGYAWVAKDWSGSAKCGGDPDPYDDERIIKIAQNTIYFVNGGGGGPYYGVESLPHSARTPDNEEMEFYLVSETELKVRFGYKKPASIIYKRTHWHDVEDEDCGYDMGFVWCIVVMTVVLVCCGCGLGLCAFRACRKKAPARAAPIIVGLPVVAEEGPVASPKGAKGPVRVISPKGARVGVIEYASEK
jgi:hypothetical protein